MEGPRIDVIRDHLGREDDPHPTMSVPSVLRRRAQAMNAPRDVGRSVGDTPSLPPDFHTPRHAW